MTHTNVLNRKLEEVYGVGKDFKTVASLWGRFNDFIRNQQVCSCFIGSKDTLHIIPLSTRSRYRVGADALLGPPINLDVHLTID